MTTRKLILPFIPNPPVEYDQIYTQQSIRSLTTYLRNMQTPGDARHTQIVLTNATTDGTTVEGNTIIIDDATGYLTLNIEGVAVSATGGTITTYSSGGIDYKVHTFLSTDDFVLTTYALVDILVVGGGGSGGKSAEGGGGGGAGGFISATGLRLPPGTYTATVGDGGAVPVSNGVGNNGTDSSFIGFVAKGGGGGGAQESINAVDGGSGGGSGGRDSGGTSAGADAVPYSWPYVFRSQEGYVAPTNYENLSQGNDGGTTTTTSGDISSGGGGAGAVGGSATVDSGPAGNGGDGVQNAFRTGSNVYYGGGGGGGTNIAGSGGLGGQGGGGRGAQSVSPVISAVAGTANTGGGGGGGSTATYAPGAGGSGIVVVRYTV